jgi:alanine racemase
MTDMNLVQSPAQRMLGLAEAVVDLSAIRDNVRTFARRVHSGTEIMAVVKADAFGHGAARVARTALDAGATWLGVARAGEAMQLRKAGLTAPIFTWLYDETELIWLEDVDVSVSNVADLHRIIAAPNVRNVHLKLDTGMHRGGSTPEQWIELTRAAAYYEAQGSISVRGVWSHLSHGDELDASHSRRQLKLLSTGVALAKRAGLTPQYVHIANSSGAITLDAPECNLARIGAGLFGIDEVGAGLHPSMKLLSKVAQVRRIKAGEGVSYSHTYVTPRDTTIALVPIGYADGIPRIAAEQASVLCRGVRMPVLGRITMDQFVVDAGDLTVEPGDPVTIFGDGSSGEPTIAEWAEWAQTIPHEIYCGLGARVPRRYIEEAQR